MALNRPLSPWAQRFRYGKAGREEFLDDVVHHSGFNTELARLHPKYYADKPLPGDDARTMAQLDRLFASESFQRSYLRGSYSWMVGPLMRYVRFSQKTGLISGGHRAADYGPVEPTNPANPANSANPADPAANVTIERQEDVTLKIFHSERVQVDESKWFPFLKKDRWLAWDQPQPLLGGGNWSVDDPRVWEVLSISMELLDRVLKALVVDKHVMLETVLYGLNVTWQDAFPGSPPPFTGAHLLFSLPYIRKLSAIRQVPCPVEFIDQLDPLDFVNRLDELLKDQRWSLVENYRGGDDVWGTTLMAEGGMILIDASPVRRLMVDDITIAERCMLHYNIMTTMLHEMFHALFHHRKEDRQWVTNLVPQLQTPEALRHLEPLFDDDPLCELGFAAEQRIFGGQLILGPQHCSDLPFGAYIMRWPDPTKGVPGRENIVEDAPMFRAGSTIYITRLSALSISKMLSAEFWDDATIFPKSANYFHSNRIFVSDTTYPGPYYTVEFNEVGLKRNLNIMLGPGEREMINTWIERNREWNELRAGGWSERARQEWQRTPWSDIRCRQLILQFGRSFARKDQIDCRWVARRLFNQIEEKEDTNRYIQALPPHARENNWVFHAIGLLMLAALPIRGHDIESKDVVRSNWRFLSSKGTVEVKFSRKRQRDDRVVSESVLLDPLGRPGQTLGADDFYQEDYLDVVGRLVDHLASNDVAVSHPWIRAILNTAEDLRRQRREGARYKRSWVKAWRFLIPPYDNAVSKFQHGRWTVQV